MDGVQLNSNPDPLLFGGSILEPELLGSDNFRPGPRPSGLIGLGY